jgi:hypothetical protein
MNPDFCNKKIIECENNKVYINQTCSDFKPSPDTDCSIIKKVNEYILPNQQPISKKTNVTLLECMKQCASIDSCDVFSYEYGNSLNGVELGSIDATCNLYSSPQISPDDITINSEHVCNSVYRKTKGSNPNCINFGPDQKWNINFANDTYGTEIPTIQTREGAECRQAVANRQIKDSTSDALMTDYCTRTENQGLDVCKRYCRNTGNCPSGNTTNIYISIGICLLSILFGIIFISKHKKNMVLISGIVMIAMIIWAIYSVIQYTRNKGSPDVIDTDNIWNKLTKDMNKECVCKNSDYPCATMEHGCECDPCYNVPVGNQYECSLSSAKKFNLYFMVGPNNDTYYIYDDILDLDNIKIFKVQKKDPKNPNLSVFTYSSLGLYNLRYNSILTIVNPYDKYKYLGFNKDRYTTVCLQIIKKSDKRYIGLSLNKSPKGEDPVCTTGIDSCLGTLVNNVQLNFEMEKNFNTIIPTDCYDKDVDNGYPIGFDFIN